MAARPDGRLRRAARILVLAVVAVVVVALSIANREPVRLSLDPFTADPAVSVTLPLYWLIFGAVALGVVIGGIATWLRQGRWRKAARHDHAEVERLRRDAERRRTAGPALPAPGERQSSAWGG